MNRQLTPFERAVLDAFLLGDDARLEQLRAQARVCTVLDRRHTGLGSFIDLGVPAGADRIAPPEIIMGDVDVQVEGLRRGGTAMLFVRGGVLSMLEFVTNEGEWPMSPVLTGIGYFRYLHPSDTGRYAMKAVPARDPETLALQLAGAPG